MSQILGPALASADPERMAEITRHDLLANVDPTIARSLRPFLNAGFFAEQASIESQKLRPFLIVIGTKQQTRLKLPVMARSSAEAVEQHLCLALDGERVEVAPHARRDVIRPELDALHAGNPPGLRQPLRAADMNLAEQFAGEKPFDK